MLIGKKTTKKIVMHKSKTNLTDKYQ